LFVISIPGYYATNKLAFMQNKLQIKSNIELMKSPDVPTVAVNQFGVTVFGIMDFKSFLLPSNETDNAIIRKNNSQEEQKVVGRGVSPFLEELANEETNKKYSSLNNYFASNKVTDYNDYTGMFEGKNVVVLLLESVGDAMINEEMFPNFYKMYSEGWHWTNNYSPRNSCATGNNEFSAMTSLYSIYNTCTSNVYKNNTYYESIFGLFNDKGYRTNSFHNFVAWYYRRDVIHPNMKSGKYYDSNKLGIKIAGYYGEWPSDIDLMEKAFNIILDDDSGKPFMTWLTTVTSHQPYSTNSTYGDLYRNDFKKLGYSNAVSRYLSKLKVVDEALGLMLKKLEEKGVLDDTVIVMLADHYPYGLNKSQVKEMIKYDINDYDIEKTPFVIYNPSMEAKEFTGYNSYINLVPTLANLLNLNYDPRLYMGTDLFSEDYESRVVFADGSWKNEKAYYNASTSKIKYYGEEKYTDEEIKEINAKVGLQIDMSSKAVKANYFNYLEKKYNEYNEKHPQNIVENETEENNEENSVNTTE
jgi:phosphoglycerol transferase MdoB-like AlkP superfamily enzyme